MCSGLLPDDLSEVSDQQLMAYIRDEIADVLIVDRVCPSDEEIDRAVKTIYPILSGIVFNVHFRLRKNPPQIAHLIRFLVRNFVRTP